MKVKLIQLLSIYKELSTSELVKKSGKTKPTVLKHLDDLVEIGQVKVRTEISPGAYDRNIYSIKRERFEIQGQNLLEQVRSDPSFVLTYNNYKLSELLILKETVDSMVEYQKRLNEEAKKCIDQSGDPEEVIKIMRDNLGGSSFQYLTKKQMLNHGPDTIHEYLQISLTLPIRRIIEQLSKEEWVIDGTLWDYSEK